MLLALLTFDNDCSTASWSTQCSTVRKMEAKVNLRLSPILTLTNENKNVFDTLIMKISDILIKHDVSLQCLCKYWMSRLVNLAAYNVVWPIVDWLIGKHAKNIIIRSDDGVERRAKEGRNSFEGTMRVFARSWLTLDDTFDASTMNITRGKHSCI